MTKEEKIEAAIKAGGKRWHKGTMNRIYFNAPALGLECEYYKSGNVRSATFNGEDISNKKASGMLFAKSYIDVEAWEPHSTIQELEDSLRELMGKWD